MPKPASLSPSPVKSVPVKSTPVLVKKKVQSQRLETSTSRPVLRAFECLIHAEEAEHNLALIGIFTGSSGDEMRKLHEQATPILKELVKLYKEYWKSIEVH